MAALGFQVAEADLCPAQDYGSVPSGNICTAKDIVLDSLTINSAVDNCEAGGVVALDLTATLGGSTNGERFDIALYLLRTGTDLLSLDPATTCSFVPAPVDTNEFANIDLDAVGDITGQGDLATPGTLPQVWVLGLTEVSCMPNSLGGVDITTLIDYGPNQDSILVGPGVDVSDGFDDTNEYEPDLSSKCGMIDLSYEIEVLGKLVVTKSAMPDDGSLYNFTFTNSSPASSTNLLPGFTPNQASPFELASGESSDDIWVNLASGDATLTVTETSVPSPYVLASVSCVDSQTGAAVTSALSGNSFSVNITAESPQVECTVSNEAASLTLQKAVINDDGGTTAATNWILSYDDGAGNTGSGVTGDASVTAVLLPAGTYSLAESGAVDYTLESISCTGSDPDGTDGLVLALAEEVVCTFTNNDLPRSIAVVKTADTSGFSNPVQPGDQITYTYAVTNTGEVDLYDITLSESLFTGTGALPSPIFVSGGADLDGDGDAADLSAGGGDSPIVFTATYTLTQSDIDAGAITNQATASSTDPSGGPVADLSDESGTAQGDDDPTITPIPQSPGIALIKSGVLDVGTDGIASVGDTITYSFTVTNTGNVTLTNVTVTDPLPGIVISGSIASLAPGAVDSTTITATYALTQADIDAGGVTNQATATGSYTDASGATQITDDLSDDDSNLEDQPTLTPIPQLPSLSIVKTADPQTYTAEGQLIDYSYEITNTGNTTITGLALSDDRILAPDTVDCGGVTELVPVASVTCSATYSITAADLGVTTVTNTATVSGVTPTGTSASATTSETIESRLTDLQIIKTDSSDTYTPGQGSTYVITVRNNGLVDVAGALVQDTLPLGVIPDGDWSCEVTAGTASCISGLPDASASGIGDISQLIDLSVGGEVQFSVPVIYSEDPNAY